MTIQTLVKHQQPISNKFIAIDGEGYTPENTDKQIYYLLCASTGEYIEDITGLSTIQCLQFLLELKIKYPDKVFIGFGLSYDISMMLIDCSYDLLQSIHEFKKFRLLKRTQIPCYSNYGIEYMKRKYIKIYDYKIENNKKIWNNKTKSHITNSIIEIYDTWGFFQKSFLGALKEYHIGTDYLQFIETMKNNRNEFNINDADKIREYCILECKLLTELLDYIDNLLLSDELDIQLRRYDGAGSIASSMLKKHGVKKHLEKPDDDILQIALHSFAGGRIECIQYGNYNKPVYNYDINSAYPKALLNLPSLAGGTWKKENTAQTELCLIKIEWDFTNCNNVIYPFSYRTAKGLICYPKRGSNWIYGNEYKAYLKHKNKYGIHSVKILEAYNFYPKTQIKPYSFIKEYVEKRLLWKQQNKQQHVMVKLGLNSLYGKTAQQIGGEYNLEKKELVLPAYHNIIYAGYVTSWCRSEIYNLAMENELSTICFMTDGILTTEKRNIVSSNELGKFEETIIDNLTIAQSGIYFYDKDGIPQSKTRGFNKNSITREQIISAYKKNLTFIEGDYTKFITFGMIANIKDNKLKLTKIKEYCKWVTDKRELSLIPLGTKRISLNNNKPHNDLIMTLPVSISSTGNILNITDFNDGEIPLSTKYKYVYNIPYELLTEIDKNYLYLINEIEESVDNM